MRKKPSISDIAREAGVSIASVSYVLNGIEKEKRVGAQIAEKIRKTAASLNYEASHIARSLRNGSTKTIGLIVADIANEFFGDMAKSIEEEAYRHGYSVIFGSSDEDMSKSKMLTDTLISRQVDGLIITPIGNPEERMNHLAGQLPLVMVDRYVDVDGLNYIVLDNHLAAYDAVKHLHAQGYRKIGIIGYQTRMLHIRDRFQGYTDALAEYLPEAIPMVGEVQFQSIDKDIERLLDGYIKNDQLDAIIFATNSLTIAGLYYCQRKNIRIPEQLAIIGFDGNVAFDFFYAPLTYIKQPVKDIGKTAVNVLLDTMKNTSNGQQKKLSHELIVRAST